MHMYLLVAVRLLPAIFQANLVVAITFTNKRHFPSPSPNPVSPQTIRYTKRDPLASLSAEGNVLLASHLYGIIGQGNIKAVEKYIGP